MIGHEAAGKLRRLADAFDKIDHIPCIQKETLDEENQLGAAFILLFLRDMFTIAGKDNFTREDILVLLNMLQNDREIFTIDLIALMEMD